MRKLELYSCNSSILPGKSEMNNKKYSQHKTRQLNKNVALKVSHNRNKGKAEKPSFPAVFAHREIARTLTRGGIEKCFPKEE